MSSLSLQSELQGYSLLTGISISATLSIFYVLVIYLNKNGSVAVVAPDGKEQLEDRNNPQVIRSRINKITALTFLVLAVLPPVLSKLSQNPLKKIYAEFGILLGYQYRSGELSFSMEYLKLSLRDIAQTSVLLICILYIGPLIDYVVFKSTSPLEIFHDFHQELMSIQGVRDLFFGPLTEEIIYTASIIVSLFQVPGIANSLLIFLPPVFFSFAHVHHAIELYWKKVDIKIIIISTVFQMLYTFLFGIFTNFVFLRTDNLWACFILHSFCNFMGPPSFNVDTPKFKYWRYFYYVLLGLGIFGFKKLLFTFTESSLSLVEWP